MNCCLHLILRKIFLARTICKTIGFILPNSKFLNQVNDVDEFSQRIFTLRFYDTFSRCFQKPITHVYSRHIRKKTFPIEDTNFRSIPPCQFSDIRVIFLFTDISCSWSQGLILDYTFLMIYKKYFFVFGTYICKCSSLLSLRDTAKPILM